MTGERPGPALRLAVLGDFDSPHTRRWLRFFVERGHEVHAVSYYAPRAELPGVRLHSLTAAAPPSDRAGPPGAPSRVKRLLPPTLLRLAHALRYQRAGLRRVLDEIAPDVFHAHYAVEHGFYGAFGGRHPYVVSAWGSDIFVEAQRPLGRLIARFALRRADFVTANDTAMARQIEALGVPADRIGVIRLGIDDVFFTGRRNEASDPTVISDRALERLYNLDVVLRAFARLRQRLPASRLLIAHDGSERARLEDLARRLGLGDAVRFLGRLSPEALRDALAAAQVYVSAPSSDSFPLSTLEAMAAGAFPVVSDLPSQDGWIAHGQNGLRVPPRDVSALASALYEALMNDDLRANAAGHNRRVAEAAGSLERNMLVMERHYYRLAGKIIAGEASI